MKTLRSTLLVAALAVGVTPVVTHAAQSATAGSNKCTVTAVAPTLSGTTITAKVTVLCTISSSVSVEIGVVEMDGTVEDAKTEIALSWKSVALTANKAVTITITGTCVNTETGNEELASKTRVNISGTVSAYDRTVPKTDSYAC